MRLSFFIISILSAVSVEITDGLVSLYSYLNLYIMEQNPEKVNIVYYKIVGMKQKIYKFHLLSVDFYIIIQSVLCGSLLRRAIIRFRARSSLDIFIGGLKMKFFKSLNPVTQKAIAGVLAAVLIFTVGFTCGSYSKILAVISGKSPVAVSSGAEQQTQSAPTSTTAAQQPSSTAPAANSGDAAAEKPAAGNSANTQSGKPGTVDEIVAYYNAAANKVKTDAASVTLNYTDRMSNDEYLQVSDSLKSIASFAMNKFLTKDDNPVTYTGDEIKQKFPVKEQDYSSKLDVSQVKSATCDDNGSEYEIRIELNNDDTPNCTAGNGYGTVMNYLKEEEIALDYPGLSISDVKLTYHDGVIVAKVDKATGNLVAANYTMPVVLALNAKVLVSTIPAQIGMTFVEDYTITY